MPVGHIKIKKKESKKIKKKIKGLNRPPYTVEGDTLMQCIHQLRMRDRKEMLSDLLGYYRHNVLQENEKFDQDKYDSYLNSLDSVPYFRKGGDYQSNLINPIN